MRCELFDELLHQLIGGVCVRFCTYVFRVHARILEHLYVCGCEGGGAPVLGSLVGNLQKAQELRIFCIFFKLEAGGSSGSLNSRNQEFQHHPPPNPPTDHPPDPPRPSQTTPNHPQITPRHSPQTTKFKTGGA